ncbi:uncharacterized protein TRIADDRAFT_61806 [Trichoplax adhaerens]|uniref:Uncharacterized protein n=1 Tax=Trichoplax adhaerens TaxID=10228 RepID=B3SC08_TRIAD|nr:hypothetical protein TRIADDRAFT_61806 [Trichoplax adhaerens]EDV19767.1 hypothetical protein TRIADDRAFT_61806 [Trichoplax adhaerens]|eukprot:XP_002117791.1 hypothetical protein TRIADDRAFT_61806 [Trichoplax adhaerens]
MPISCLSWIPKGIARSHPTKVTSDILSRSNAILILHYYTLSGNVETLELNGSVQAEADIDKELSEYNLQDYDQDEVCDLYKLNPYEDNIIDPSISQFDTESEGSSDIIIGPHDNLAVVGVTNNNANALEIYRNLVAVGTKASFIEIWDIDNINCLQPVATLGNASNLTDDNLRRIKSPLKSHNDSVLDLSWNRSARTILASASADQAVILWDITLAKTSNIYSHHSDKVGLYDGSVYAFDVRNRDYIFRICAHNMSITDLALSYQTEGLLVTSSIDKTVKVWDITGKVYCSCFCPDNASIMFGGEKNSVSLVDLNEEFIGSKKCLCMCMPMTFGSAFV